MALIPCYVLLRGADNYGMVRKTPTKEANMKATLTLIAVSLALIIPATASAKATCTAVNPKTNTWADTSGRHGSYVDMGSYVKFKGMTPTHTVRALITEYKGSAMRRTCKSL